MFSRISRLIRHITIHLLEGLKGLEDDAVVICIFIDTEVNGSKLLCTELIVLFFGVVVF